jgi:polysaccharide export outer membrane protein
MHPQRWISVSSSRRAAAALVTLLAAERHNAEIADALTRVGLGAGDVFEVRVYEEKELSGVHRIAQSGAITFPLIGQMEVAGHNANQIAERIRQRLQNGYLRDPQVTVFVKEYNSKKIFVLGQVSKPGTFPYTGGMSVVEAITLAGGFRGSANQNYVVVTRRVDGQERRIPVPVEKMAEGLAVNLTLQAGDIVFVPDRLL